MLGARCSLFKSLLPVLGTLAFFAGITLSAAADLTTLSYFGLHIGGADSGTAWPKVQFGSWRLWDANVQWPQLEPQRGQWQFEQLDRYAGMSQLTKVSILLPLGLSPRWASARPNEVSAYGEGKAAEPRMLDDWRNYVRMVATRYKGKITDYEIWNEPNDRHFFSGTVESLVSLTCAAQAVLKEVHPANRLVSPAYTGEGNVKRLDDFLAKGGRKCVDVVAYHLYVMPSPPEAIPPLVSHVQEVMRKHGIAQLPLWNTESGWATFNEDGTSDKGKPEGWESLRGSQMAAYVARSLILGRAAGLDRFYWYAWDNKFMGLIEPEAKTYKTGADAYGLVADWLVGRETPTCEQRDSVWICRFKRGADGERLIVWRTRPGRFVYLIPAGRKLLSAARADFRGNELSVTGAVNINEVPTLIHLAN